MTVCQQPTPADSARTSGRRTTQPDTTQPGTAPEHGRAVGWVLGSATVATGLFAGVLYAFACAVMVGLHGTDDRTFVDVMQRINASIQNPVFFASFFGALVLPGVAVVLLRRNGSRAALRWTLAGLALCLVGFVITAAFNIPLNDQLAHAGDPSRIRDLAAVRARFETPWVAWNIARTVVCTAAVGCLGRALLLHGRSGRAAH